MTIEELETALRAYASTREFSPRIKVPQSGKVLILEDTDEVASAPTIREAVVQLLQNGLSEAEDAAMKAHVQARTKSELVSCLQAQLDAMVRT